MKEYEAHKVPVQSLIDHIKTAIDVDPWAKEMAEDLLKERQKNIKVEFIESYVKIGDNDYQWSDNHGELIRCKDCKHGKDIIDGLTQLHYILCTNKGDHYSRDLDWFCADGEKRDGNK